MTEDKTAQRVVDPVSDEVPGAREIGFSLPEQYNASAVLFDNLSNGNADKAALRGAFGEFTYGEVCRSAAQAGNGLLSLGLQREDRVLLFLEDTPAYPAFVFGGLRAGLVPVLVNTLTPPDLLAFYLSDTGARVAVVDAALADRFSGAAVQGTALEALIVVNGAASGPEGVKTVVADDWLEQQPPDLAAADTHRDDMAFWMYSSGSTGRPKGIVHLHHDMPYADRSFARHILKLTRDDVCFSVPKIFFAYGMGNSLTFSFSAGACTILHGGRPDPAAVLDAVNRYRPTVFFGLPTLYTALVRAPEAKATDFGSLRLCVSAAEVLSQEVFGAWKGLTGHEIVEGLGSTEMLHVYLSNTEDDKRAGSAGRRVPGYEVKLVDVDGKEVAQGEEGVMMVRGQSSAPLYWNRPDKTEETMRGDWIYTGDRFVQDGDGFYYFRGRADDLIKVSGQWVYPLEVEHCLAEHPAVTEVAVLGLEMADRRMTLKAFVVPKDPDADHDALTKQLQDYVKKTLLPHKYPRVVEYMPELPKTGTGKIDRQTLRQRGI